eukprot:ctg_2045.g471
MFFVAGITGNVGGATARQLLDKGHRVRALVRDPVKASQWSQEGVEIVQGDFKDANAVAAALQGVEGAYLMLPPYLGKDAAYTETKAMIASFREALQKTPPPRLVLLSSIGSDRESGVGPITQTHLLEEAMADLPFPIAYIRAAAFVENYMYALKAAASTGYLDTFWTPTDRPVPVIGTVDIGREVARLLIGGWSGKKIVELGTRTSADDLARALSQVLGRSVQARAVPREQWTEAFRAIGLPPNGIAAYTEMVDGCNSGWIDFGAPGAELAPATTTPEEVFAQVMKK